MLFSHALLGSFVMQLVHGFVAMATYASNVKCQVVLLYSLYGWFMKYTFLFGEYLLALTVVSLLKHHYLLRLMLAGTLIIPVCKIW